MSFRMVGDGFSTEPKMPRFDQAVADPSKVHGTAGSRVMSDSKKTKT